jgi:hypothetical protein
VSYDSNYLLFSNETYRSRVVYLADFRCRKIGSSLAFFYCNPSTTASIVLGSFITQLISQFEMLLKPIPAVDRIEHRTSLDENELIEILLDLAASSLETIFILDGLDECRPADGEKILHFFEQVLLTVTKVANSTCRAFISSREDSNGLERLSSCYTRLALRDADVEKDIWDYVDNTVDDKIKMNQLKVRDPNLTSEIRKKLFDGAEGMYVFLE